MSDEPNGSPDSGRNLMASNPRSLPMMPAPGPGKSCVNCSAEIEDEYVVYETRIPDAGTRTYFCSEECLKTWL